MCAKDPTDGAAAQPSFTVHKQTDSFLLFSFLHTFPSILVVTIYLNIDVIQELEYKGPRPSARVLKFPQLSLKR